MPTDIRLLDLTLASPAANLAFDEALLLDREAHGSGGLLRFWECSDYFIVLGYAARMQEEINLEACEMLGLPVLRRCSGGGTVVQGPGCLNYTLVLPLSIVEPGSAASISATNRFIMERHRAALAPLLGPSVAVAGHTDLILGDRKFSGNAQRRRREWFLFHGTFLIDLNLKLISQTLRPPIRQPAYRHERPHEEFLTCLGLTPPQIKDALMAAWSVTTELDAIVEQRRLEPSMAELIRERYGRDEWNRR